MFPFLRHDRGRPGPREAPQGTSGGTAVLPDVRETPEGRAGHAPGALRLLPLSRLLAGASLPPVALGPVVTVCLSGRHSRQTAELPTGRDVEAAGATDGMTDWTPADLPVTGEGDRGGVIP